MSTIYDKLGHQFTVSAADSQHDVDTTANVLKRREKIVFQSSLEPSASSVAFLSGTEISSDRNLSIFDRSGSLSANRVITTSTTIEESKHFSISTEKFLVTDVFVTGLNVEPTPLYFKHTVNTTLVPRASSGAMGTDVSLMEVAVLDSTMRPLSVPELILDLDRGVVYNNLQSSFSDGSNYSVYYVRYVVNNAGTISTHVDLLDNTPTFELADIDDLTAMMTIKQDGRKVYLLEEIDNEYKITLPTVGTYAYRQSEDSILKLLPPVAKGKDDPWFCRITNGSFWTPPVQTGSGSAGGDTVYFYTSGQKYEISEFMNQSFSPQPPIKQVVEEESSILSKSLIKLDRENIREDNGLDLHVSIQLAKADGTSVAAMTTDSSLVGTMASNGQVWSTWSTSNRYGIKSVDYKTGFVDIEGLPMKTTWSAVSSYYFDETTFELTALDLNPVNNPHMLGLKTTFAVYPTSSSQTTNNGGNIHYLQWDETDRAEVWGGANGAIYERSPVSGIVFDFFGVPVNIYYETYPSGWRPITITSGYYLPEYLIGPFEQENFMIWKDLYTVETSTPSAVAQALILGDVTVGPAIRPDMLDVSDARQRGGGIAEDSYSLALAAQGESQWYWDESTWDGVAYPANASYFVEVPVTVLDGAGGEFTQQDVRDIVNRHTAAGVYGITKAYGVDIEVSGVYPGGTSITVEWHSDEY